MRKHPNEFTRRWMQKFFASRQREARVIAVENSYVIFFRRFNFIEACVVDEPAGRLVYDETAADWTLFWMNGCLHWRPYNRYESLDQALRAMLSEQAASLFQKVL